MPQLRLKHAMRGEDASHRRVARDRAAARRAQIAQQRRRVASHATADDTRCNIDERWHGIADASGRNVCAQYAELLEGVSPHGAAMAVALRTDDVRHREICELSSFGRMRLMCDTARIAEYLRSAPAALILLLGHQRPSHGLSLLDLPCDATIAEAYKQSERYLDEVSVPTDLSIVHMIKWFLDGIAGSATQLSHLLLARSTMQDRLVQICKAYAADEPTQRTYAAGMHAAFVKLADELAARTVATQLLPATYAVLARTLEQVAAVERDTALYIVLAHIGLEAHGWYLVDAHPGIVARMYDACFATSRVDVALHAIAALAALVPERDPLPAQMQYAHMREWACRITADAPCATDPRVVAALIDLLRTHADFAGSRMYDVGDIVTAANWLHEAYKRRVVYAGVSQPDIAAAIVRVSEMTARAVVRGLTAYWAADQCCALALAP